MILAITLTLLAIVWCLIAYPGKTPDNEFALLWQSQKGLIGGLGFIILVFALVMFSGVGKSPKSRCIDEHGPVLCWSDDFDINRWRTMTGQTPHPTPNATQIEAYNLYKQAQDAWGRDTRQHPQASSRQRVIYVDANGYPIQQQGR